MLTAQGLSPPVRGNLVGKTGVFEVEGSIPACAGEPDYADSINVVQGVYPRLCGGTTADRSENPRSRGLSPPVRGNRRG